MIAWAVCNDLHCTGAVVACLQRACYSPLLGISAGLSRGSVALLQLEKAGTGMAGCTAAHLPAYDL